MPSKGMLTGDTSSIGILLNIKSKYLNNYQYEQNFIILAAGTRHLMLPKNHVTNL